MDIEWLRDLIIIIVGILTIIIIVGTTVGLIRLYRQTRRTQEKIQDIVDKIHEIIAFVQDMTKPLLKIISMIWGKHDKGEELHGYSKGGEKNE